MDTTLYLSFLAISLAVIVLPGPNVLLIVSTSLAHGTLRGLQTVAGTTTAMLLQWLVVASGIAWMIETLGQALVWLRWVGAMYLVYLGIQQFALAARKQTAEETLSAGAGFVRGFVVSLTNPKTLLFFAAFLPQFISPVYSYTLQVTILAASFMLLALVCDSTYALLAGRTRIGLQSLRARGLRHGFSGILYLLAGSLIALRRQA